MLSQDLGYQRLVDFSDLFNVGRATGIDLSEEQSGVLPTREWFLQNYSEEKINRGYIMNMAIGQGDIRMTPLQIAVLYAAIANEGIIITPKIVVGEIENSGKETIYENEVSKVLEIEPSIFREVKKALWAVTNEGGGTAFNFADHTIPDASGKTGTSQVISNIQKKKIDIVEEDKKQMANDDALFAAFFPSSSPEIVAVAIIEHGEHGGSAAAPVVYRLLKAYYQKGKIKSDYEEN